LVFASSARSAGSAPIASHPFPVSPGTFAGEFEAPTSDTTPVASASTDLLDIPGPDEKKDSSVNVDDIVDIENAFIEQSKKQAAKSGQAAQEPSVNTDDNVDIENAYIEQGDKQEAKSGQATQDPVAADLKKEETPTTPRRQDLPPAITAAELKVRNIPARYVWKDKDDLESVAEVLYGDPDLYPLLVDGNVARLILPDNIVPGTKFLVLRPPDDEEKLKAIRANSFKSPYTIWQGCTLRHAQQ
jgi:hypothetical protein